MSFVFEKETITQNAESESEKEKERLEKIREKFFSFLSKKPSSSGGAAEYLSRFEMPENFFDLLLNEAENLNLIDDEAYAKLFFEGHLTWGNAKITHELLNRGVDREIIQEILAQGEDESSRALELIQSWQKLGVDERKIISRLLSRGFSYSSIKSCDIDRNN